MYEARIYMSYNLETANYIADAIFVFHRPIKMHVLSKLFQKGFLYGINIVVLFDMSTFEQKNKGRVGKAIKLIWDKW